MAKLNIGKTGDGLKASQDITDGENVEMSVDETGDNADISQKVNGETGKNKVWIQLFIALTAIAGSYFGYKKFVASPQEPTKQEAPLIDTSATEETILPEGETLDTIN